MPNRFRATGSLIAVVLAVAGCGSLTEPQLLTDFEWGEVDDPATVQPGIQTAVVLGELYVLGQMQTPTRCYRLTKDFDQSGSRLTLKVTAAGSNTANCNVSQGGYRYTLVVHNLKFDTYDLRVTHAIEGGQDGHFADTVTVR
ncbi:MAG: hypothetical protein PVH00_07785 [Gemmatimonadota bacterium]|jgi:hypothetical protein